MKGKLKWFNSTKGFGFIAGDDGNDYFVHTSQLPQDEKLEDGEEIEFETKDTEKGLQAIEVKKIIPDTENF